MKRALIGLAAAGLLGSSCFFLEAQGTSFGFQGGLLDDVASISFDRIRRDVEASFTAARFSDPPHANHHGATGAPHTGYGVCTAEDEFSKLPVDNSAVHTALDEGGSNEVGNWALADWKPASWALGGSKSFGWTLGAWSSGGWRFGDSGFAEEGAASGSVNKPASSSNGRNDAFAFTASGPLVGAPQQGGSSTSGPGTNGGTGAQGSLQAPEIDVSSTVAALTFLLGSLVVIRGRARRAQTL